MTGRRLTAFKNGSVFARGTPEEVWAHAILDSANDGGSCILVFDDATGKLVDLDPRQPPETKIEQVGESRPGRGRPRLGVVSREITLLPRHWDFLNGEPGGASAALRRLVDEERRRRAASGDPAAARAAAYAFLTAIAGDFADYEEAIRALFGGELGKFERITRAWPEAIAAYAIALGFPGDRDATERGKAT